MTSTYTDITRVASFGCSFAFGDEMSDRSKRYSSLISKKLNAKLLDYSAPGLSNEIISQNIVNYLLAADRNKAAETLVIVEWTFSNRFNYCGKNNRYYVIANYNIGSRYRTIKLREKHNHIYFNDDFDDLMDVKSYYDMHTNLTYMMYNMTKYVHHAQMFLENNGYRYVFLFARDEESEFVLSNQFDILGLRETRMPREAYPYDSYPYFQHQLNDINKSLICPVPFLSYTYKNNFLRGPEGHPLEEAHIAYSNVLYDFIESKHGKQAFHRSESGVS